MVRNAAVLLILGALLGVTAPPAEAQASGLSGRPLTEALLALQERGLKIAFTSQLVRPEMRVEAEPRSGSLPEILGELLAPHGLMAEEGPGGLWVVVPRPEAPAEAPGPGAVRGIVRQSRGHGPLAGVRILIPEAGVEGLSTADGTFSLGGLARGTYTLEAHLPGFVVEQVAGVTVEAGHVAEVSFVLAPAPLPLDEIVVVPSLVTLLRNDPVAALAFDREEILALPHLGGDLFRALSLVPGASGNEVSAEIHVRGGRADEVLVMLDDVELFEPFHLKDFSNAFSIIAPQAIAGVDLMLGGFPAEYGDRMGGVLEMSTVAPDWDLKIRLGLSLLNTQAGASGTFDDGGGHWLGVARYGSLELVKNYVDQEEQPRFWDLFAKVERQLGKASTLGARVLHADDTLDFVLADIDGESEIVTTDYGNSYLWLTHQALLDPSLFVDTATSLGRVDRDRNSDETEELNGEDLLGFSVHDERALDVAALRQSWNFQAAERHYLKWGLDLRRLEANYDYQSVRQLENPIEDVRGQPLSGTTTFLESFSGEQYGVYFSDRIRLFEPLTVELGLRYDEQTVTDDRDVSPRVSLAYALGKASSLRAAWGHYFQSQRLYELQVPDGETEFSSAERTEDYVLGFEHLFLGGPTLRLNAYHRDIFRPRTRYENIYEPISVVPEIEPDRARIDPERSTSRGVEAFLRGPGGGKVGWWASYVYSEIEDEIGGRGVPRSIDQTHAVKLDLALRLGPHWSLNLAWRYHTGWPTTAFSAVVEENDEGELEAVPVFGPLNAERLPDYHRLDMRISRQWQLKKGALTFYLDLQNSYDRNNVSGFDVDEFEFEVGPDGQPEVSSKREFWPDFLPSFGIDWEF